MTPPNLSLSKDMSVSRPRPSGGSSGLGGGQGRRPRRPWSEPESPDEGERCVGILTLKVRTAGVWHSDFGWLWVSEIPENLIRAVDIAWAPKRDKFKLGLTGSDRSLGWTKP